MPKKNKLNLFNVIKMIIVIFVFFMAFKPVYSQWIYRSIGAYFSLESIYFTDLNTGYATVENGVGKTTNGGINWVPVFSVTWGCRFRSVYFINSNTGFIAGWYVGSNTGIVLKTTNAGYNWTAPNLPTAPRFTTVYFINQNTGYVSGNGVILKTTNTGATWEIQNIPFTGVLFAICFTDVNTGYVVGDSGAVFKTTNGGSNWFPGNSTTSINLRGISFANANTGIAVGGDNGNSFVPPVNIILKTTNAGNNWSEVQFNTHSDSLLWNVNFINSSTGYITGWGSNITKTTNSGNSWYNQNCPVPGQILRNSFFVNDNTGYICGYNDTAGSLVLKTTNGGENFVGIKTSGNEIPNGYTLHQNYPNPFNPVTKINYELPITNYVKLAVYDILGREVVVLINRKQSAGKHEIEWNASNYTSGTYFYKLTAGDYTETKKMMLVK